MLPGRPADSSLANPNPNQERMLLGHPANSTYFMQPGGKLAVHVQDGSPLTAEVHEDG